MVLRGLAQKLLVTFLILSLVAPLSVWSAPTSLGTARGTRAVELSLDGGKTWLPLGGSSLPVIDGAQLRSTTGSTFLELGDGSRINVLPFSSVRFQETEGTTKVSLLYGRLVFRLPTETRVGIFTPVARLEPVRQEAMEGELFVSETGLTGLKMKAGMLEARPLAEAHPTMLASRDPVFFPKRPPGPGPLFSSDARPRPAPGAKGVFTPKGESIGYLQPDGQLVIHPGFTADLTRPFSPKLVKLATAAIPEKHRTGDAVPLFDVNGRYAGYLAGPAFYAQAQQTALAAAEGTAGATPALTAAGAGLFTLVGGGVGITSKKWNEHNNNKNNKDDDDDATPVEPDDDDDDDDGGDGDDDD